MSGVIPVRGAVLPRGLAPATPPVWRLVTWGDYQGGTATPTTPGSSTWIATESPNPAATVRFSYTRTTSEAAGEGFVIPLPWAVAASGLGSMYFDLLDAGAEQAKQALFAFGGYGSDAQAAVSMFGLLSVGASATGGPQAQAVAASFNASTGSVNSTTNLSSVRSSVYRGARLWGMIGDAIYSARSGGSLIEGGGSGAASDPWSARPENIFGATSWGNVTSTHTPSGGANLCFFLRHLGSSQSTSGYIDLAVHALDVAAAGIPVYSP